ncbi:MAG TPA: cytosine permease [Vicinamibacteria bacterium]
MKAVELGVVEAGQRTQPAFDLFLIFAGADIVATTLVTGASLVPAFSTGAALGLIAAGSVAGAALVAALAPVGPQLGVPSIVAARAALGRRGADLLALLLYLTNFAWIALNNVIAASACAVVAGGAAAVKPWAVALGLLATVVVALGPRAVGWADRVAVPLMAAVAVLLTWRCLSLPPEVVHAAGSGGLGFLRGLDVVIGYQVSWLLMFADYSRYTASARRGALAVFSALALMSVWFMALGALLARAAGSPDTGRMLAAAGVHASGALLLALATVTTNFVNIYLSALAWKSLFPRASDSGSVWSIGLIGAALGLLSARLLEGYADFMLFLGGLLVPAGGVFLARFFLRREPVDVAALYDDRGPYRGVAWRGVLAWALGAIVYHLAAPIGGTLPALATSVAAAWLGDRLPPRARA